MRRSRGSVRLDVADDDEADFDDDDTDEADNDEADEADDDDEDEDADEADDPGPDDDAPTDCEARVDCASARGDDRRLLIVGTSTAASVMASDTRLTTRRWNGDPRRPIVSSVGRRRLGRARPQLPSSRRDFSDEHR